MPSPAAVGMMLLTAALEGALVAGARDITRPVPVLSRGAMSSSGTAPSCASASNCSLNGVCTNGACVCDAPWTGARCGHLAFAAASPAVGKDLANTTADLGHNTWNGPMVQSANATVTGAPAEFHMYDTSQPSLGLGLAFPFLLPHPALAP